MSDAAADNYLGAIKASLQNPNMVLDLRIPKTKEYEQDVLDTAVSQYIAGELTAEETMQQITDGWNQITDQVGRDAQLAAYHDEPWRPAIDRSISSPAGSRPRRDPRAAPPPPSDPIARRLALGRRRQVAVHLADRPRHPVPVDLPARRVADAGVLEARLRARAASTSTSSASRTSRSCSSAPSESTSSASSRRPTPLGWVVLGLGAAAHRPGPRRSPARRARPAARRSSSGSPAALLAAGLLWLVVETLFSEGGRPGSLVVTIDLRLRGIAVQYLLGLGLALLAVQPLRGRRFFRVVFLLPLTITPIGVGYMFRMMTDTGKGPLEPLFGGPRAWASYTWVTDPWAGPHRGHHRRHVAVDAVRVHRPARRARGPRPGGPRGGARRRGRRTGQSFRHITLPAILPVSTTIVLIRLIEGFKIIDMPNILHRRRPRDGDPVADPPGVSRLADAQPRPIGGDRLHPADPRDDHRHRLRRLVRAAGSRTRS